MNGYTYIVCYALSRQNEFFICVDKISHWWWERDTHFMISTDEWQEFLCRFVQITLIGSFSVTHSCKGFWLSAFPLWCDLFSLNTECAVKFNICAHFRSQILLCKWIMYLKAVLYPIFSNEQAWWFTLKNYSCLKCYFRNFYTPTKITLEESLITQNIMNLICYKI